MQINLIVFLLGMMNFYSCNSDPSTVDQAMVQKVTGNNNDLPAYKEACDFFDLEEVARFFNWDANSVITEQRYQLAERGRTLCTYNYPNGDYFSLRLRWQNEKSQQKKNLERQFKNYLTVGEKEIKYQEVSTNKGTESVFGYTALRGNTWQYIWRTRYENRVEVTIEVLSTKNDPVLFQNKLADIFQRINK